MILYKYYLVSLAIVRNNAVVCCNHAGFLMDSGDPMASASASVSGNLVPRLSGCVRTRMPERMPIPPNISEGMPA